MRPVHAGALIAGAISLHLAACAGPPEIGGTGRCTGSASANREVVLSFYREGLIGRRPGAAFEQFAAPGMVEHKPDVPDGTRAAVVEYLEALMADLPKAQWEVLRAAAEGDLVFVHARFVPEPGAEPYAIADVFRLENCMLVEHWDVVAPPPKDQRNPHSRF